MRSASSHPLVPYGWDADWAAEFAPYAAAGLLPGRVVRVDIPSPRKITSWIMCRQEDLSTKDDERLLQVRLAALTSPAPATSPAPSTTWSHTAEGTC
jgi:hypothetical protein